MSTVQRAAQVFGWIFVIVAIWGFFVSGGSMETQPEVAPEVLGLFPVNILHNLFHLASGVLGIVAARHWDWARTYCRTLGVIYLLLIPLGFITPSLLGIMPIGGNDIWLHAFLGIGLAYFGFAAAPARRPTA